jgi:hypothetical protein
MIHFYMHAGHWQEVPTGSQTGYYHSTGTLIYTHCMCVLRACIQHCVYTAVAALLHNVCAVYIVKVLAVCFMHAHLIAPFM